VVLQFSSQD